MPRAPRIQYENAVYHVMARGDRREPIFLDDKDRRIFLGTLAEACRRTGWEVLAWVLVKGQSQRVKGVNRQHLTKHSLLPSMTGRVPHES